MENVSLEDGEYGMEDMRAGHRKCVGGRWGIRMEETRAGYEKCVGGRRGIRQWSMDAVPVKCGGQFRRILLRILQKAVWKSTLMQEKTDR